MSPDSMTSGWYYAKAGAPVGQETGPLSWEELYLLARAGTVAPQDLVWNPKLPRGVVAGQIPGLFAPPPTPQQPPVRAAAKVPEAEPPILPAPPLPSPVLPVEPPAPRTPPAPMSPPPAPEPLPVLSAQPPVPQPLPVLLSGSQSTPVTTEPPPQGPPEEAARKDLFAERTAATGEVTPALEQPVPPRVKKRSRNLPWLVVLLALVVAGAGLVAYFLFLRDDARSDQTTTTVSVPANSVGDSTPPARGAWTVLTPAGDIPSARSGHTLVYDPSTARAILFGGEHLDTKLGDTWAFDPTALTWTRLDPSGVAPSARKYSQMVCDTASAKMIMFGGEDASGSRNDTWAYDPLTGSWTDLSPAGAVPAPRFGHAMVYDPDSRQVVLFGGVNSSTAGLLNDLWAYDPTDNAWTRLEPPGTLPVKRMWHALVYDPASRRVILFGGYGGTSGSMGANLDDLWAYDPAVNEWIELARVGERPLARQGHALLLDPASGDLLLFGGCDGLTGLDDMWGYDPSANSWNQSVPTGDVPEGRDGHAMTYDSVGRTIILFGGYDFTGNFDFNDTWAYGVGPGEDSP